MSNPEEIKQLNENWNIIAPITFGFEKLIPESDWVHVSQRIREFYFGSQMISNRTADQLEKVYSDRNFFQGIRNTILAQAKHNSTVYPYFFDYKGTKSWLETFYNVVTTGVAHADDFAYIFKFYLDPHKPETGMGLEANSTAENMSKKLIKLLVSFAETGKPTALWVDVKWPPTSIEEANGSISLGWYHFDLVPTWQRETEAFTKRMDFWNDILSTSSASFRHSEL